MYMKGLRKKEEKERLMNKMREEKDKEELKDLTF